MGGLTMLNAKQLHERRARRTRYRVIKGAKGRLRLSVFRSSKHIYAQVIDDGNGKTVAAASSLDKELKEKLKTGANVDAAKAVGELVAGRAVKAGVWRQPVGHRITQRDRESQFGLSRVGAGNPGCVCRAAGWPHLRSAVPDTGASPLRLRCLSHRRHRR